MEKFTIREATSEDKEAVLATHENVFAGFDYLSEFYDYFMSVKNVKSFVLLHEKKIIGFNTACLVDDGYTFVSRAARINPEYEGKGLYKKLDQYITSWAKSQKVSIKALTSTESNPTVTKPAFQSQNKQILTKDIFIYTFSPDKIKLNESDVEKSKDIAELSDSLLTNYFHDEDISKYLFPQQRVIVDFVPLRPTVSNIPFMRGPRDFTAVFSDVRIEGDKYVGMLSFGTLYEIKAFPYRYSVDIYGRDVNSLKIHILRHLVRMKQNCSGTVALVVILEESFQPELIEDILKEHGGVKAPGGVSDGISKQQYLFEKTLQMDTSD